MNREGILVIGSANMDLVVSTERFPNPGETIFGKKFNMFPGGKGANQAVCCAMLGSKTLFIAKMGNDDFCKRISKNLEHAGVGLQYLLIDDEGSTGTALITVDKTGENKIIVIPGSNMKLSPFDIDQKKNLFSEVKIAIAQLEIPTDTVIKAATLAKENEATFILNPAPAQELPEKLFSLVDYLTPNETELEILSGITINNETSIEKAARILLNKGVKNVIVTIGVKGAFLINNERKEIFPTNKVKVVDTTGAGDAFNGALAFALSNGEEVDKAIHFANLVASHCITKMGAQSSMPKLEEINIYKIAT
jgi:ribokinase